MTTPLTSEVAIETCPVTLAEGSEYPRAAWPFSDNGRRRA